MKRTLSPTDGRPGAAAKRACGSAPAGPVSSARTSPVAAAAAAIAAARNLHRLPLAMRLPLPSASMRGTHGIRADRGDPRAKAEDRTIGVLRVSSPARSAPSDSRRGAELSRTVGAERRETMRAAVVDVLTVMAARSRCPAGACRACASVLVVSATIDVTHYSDPGCPWAWSASPHHAVLHWRYGDQLAWRLVMIGLAEDASRYDARGYTPVRQAEGFLGFRRLGMPFDTQPRERNLGTGRACPAVVAGRPPRPPRGPRGLRAPPPAPLTPR